MLDREQVRLELIRRMAQSGYLGAQSRMSAELGLTRQHINEFLMKRRPPPPKILKLLGLRRAVVYVQDEK